MQREIKFEGKRVDNGEWVYGCLLTGFFLSGGQDIPYIMTADGADYDCFEDITEENGIYEVTPETVGQYTGLRDKNSKEIYEGDIVEAEAGEIFTVKYGEHATSEWNDNWELGFYVKSNSEEEISRDIRTDIIFWVKYRKLEVIGNIHDNPELLEVSE